MPGFAARRSKRVCKAWYNSIPSLIWSVTGPSFEQEAEPWIQALAQLPALKHLLIPAAYSPDVIIRTLSAVLGPKADNDRRRPDLESLHLSLTDAEVFQLLAALTELTELKSLKKLVHVQSSRPGTRITGSVKLQPFRDLVALKMQVLVLPCGLSGEQLQTLFSTSWPNLQSLGFTLPEQGTYGTQSNQEKKGRKKKSHRIGDNLICLFLFLLQIMRFYLI